VSRNLILQQAAIEESQRMQLLADGIFVQAIGILNQMQGGEIPLSPSPSESAALPPGLPRAEPGIAAGARLPLSTAKCRLLPDEHSHNGLTCFPCTSPLTSSLSKQLVQESGRSLRHRARTRRALQPSRRGRKHARTRRQNKQCRTESTNE
jgi:hypothetical protein